MSKIHIVSDLHIDFQPMTLPGGDILIIAGDLAEARFVFKSYQEQSAKLNHYKEFFEIECAKYQKVFYVMGNHEHYGGRFDQTYSLLKSVLPANVTLLDKESVEYDGYIFMGATLWTDLNGFCPITATAVKGYMNDFRVISNYYSHKDVYAKLTPEYTTVVHTQTLKYFSEQLNDNRDKNFIIITHHAPSTLSIHKRFINQYYENGGYVSNLSEFILDNPNVKYWIHGHVHSPFDYTIGETRILCNPRGYPNENPFFEMLEIEV